MFSWLRTPHSSIFFQGLTSVSEFALIQHFLSIISSNLLIFFQWNVFSIFLFFAILCFICSSMAKWQFSATLEIRLIRNWKNSAWSFNDCLCWRWCKNSANCHQVHTIYLAERWVCRLAAAETQKTPQKGKRAKKHFKRAKNSKSHSILKYFNWPKLIISLPFRVNRWQRFAVVSSQVSRHSLFWSVICCYSWHVPSRWVHALIQHSLATQRY